MTDDLLKSKCFAKLNLEGGPVIHQLRACFHKNHYTLLHVDGQSACRPRVNPHGFLAFRFVAHDL